MLNIRLIRLNFLPFTYLKFLFESPKVIFLPKYPEYFISDKNRNWRNNHEPKTVLEHRKETV